MPSAADNLGVHKNSKAVLTERMNSSTLELISIPSKHHHRIIDALPERFEVCAPTVQRIIGVCKLLFGLFITIMSLEMIIDALTGDSISSAFSVLLFAVLSIGCGIYL